MLAPVMPHVTEELHSLFFAEREGEETIHLSPWPEARAEWSDETALEAGELALAVVEGMRKIKSEHKVSVAAPLGEVRVACDETTWSKIEPLKTELLAVGNASTITRADGGGEGFVETGTAGVAVAAELSE
mgnify:FL=1